MDRDRTPCKSYSSLFGGGSATFSAIGLICIFLQSIELRNFSFKIYGVPTPGRWLDLATQVHILWPTIRGRKAAPPTQGRSTGDPSAHSPSPPITFTPLTLSGMVFCLVTPSTGICNPNFKKQQQQNTQLARIPKLRCTYTFCSDKTAERKRKLI